MSRITIALLSFVSVLILSPSLPAQGGGAADPRTQARREAARLDSEGRTTEARVIIQRLIDEAPDAQAKASAQRFMALSYGFDGDCANAIKYEDMVIDYWRTREATEPQSAFYQQGEMANEGARVCLDAGDLETAEKYYRLGSELGDREPEPRTHPRSLWAFRLNHALARITARKNDKARAEFHVALARLQLDMDSAMASEQERYFAYLKGYVALYTGDLTAAETWLSQAIQANQRDPFMHALLAMTYEKQGQTERARGMYQKAYDLATGHNPPAAFTRPFARKKLAELGG